MEHPVRRIVTAERDDGTGVYSRIEPVEPVESHLKWYGIWGWEDSPRLPVPDGVQRVPSEAFPPVGFPHAVNVTVASFRPDSDPASTRRRDDEFAAQLRGGRMRERDLDTGFHRTDTIDVVFVISGEITLTQGDGSSVVLRQGDCLVQNGADHTWSNHTEEPALLGFVIFAADRAPRSRGEA